MTKDIGLFISKYTNIPYYQMGYLEFFNKNNLNIIIDFNIDEEKALLEEKYDILIDNKNLVKDLNRKNIIDLEIIIFFESDINIIKQYSSNFKEKNLFIIGNKPMKIKSPYGIDNINNFYFHFFCRSSMKSLEISETYLIVHDSNERQSTVNNIVLKLLSDNLNVKLIDTKRINEDKLIGNIKSFKKVIISLQNEEENFAWYILSNKFGFKLIDLNHGEKISKRYLISSGNIKYSHDKITSIRKNLEIIFENTNIDNKDTHINVENVIINMINAKNSNTLQSNCIKTNLIHYEYDKRNKLINASLWNAKNESNKEIYPNYFNLNSQDIEALFSIIYNFNNYNKKSNSILRKIIKLYIFNFIFRETNNKWYEDFCIIFNILGEIFLDTCEILVKEFYLLSHNNIDANLKIANAIIFGIKNENLSLDVLDLAHKFLSIDYESKRYNRIIPFELISYITLKEGYRNACTYLDDKSNEYYNYKDCFKIVGQLNHKYGDMSKTCEIYLNDINCDRYSDESLIQYSLLTSESKGIEYGIKLFNKKNNYVVKHDSSTTLLERFLIRKINQIRSSNLSKNNEDWKHLHEFSKNISTDDTIYISEFLKCTFIEHNLNFEFKDDGSDLVSYINCLYACKLKDINMLLNQIKNIKKLSRLNSIINLWVGVNNINYTGCNNLTDKNNLLSLIEILDNKIAKLRSVYEDINDSTIYYSILLKSKLLILCNNHDEHDLIFNDLNLINRTDWNSICSKYFCWINNFNVAKELLSYKRNFSSLSNSALLNYFTSFVYLSDLDSATEIKNIYESRNNKILNSNVFILQKFSYIFMVYYRYNNDNVNSKLANSLALKYDSSYELKNSFFKIN